MILHRAEPPGATISTGGSSRAATRCRKRSCAGVRGHFLLVGLSPFGQRLGDGRRRAAGASIAGNLPFRRGAALFVRGERLHPFPGRGCRRCRRGGFSRLQEVLAQPPVADLRFVRLQPACPGPAREGTGTVFPGSEIQIAAAVAAVASGTTQPSCHRRQTDSVGGSSGVRLDERRHQSPASSAAGNVAFDGRASSARRAPAVHAAIVSPSTHASPGDTGPLSDSTRRRTVSTDWSRSCSGTGSLGSFLRTFILSVLALARLPRRVRIFCAAPSRSATSSAPTSSTTAAKHSSISAGVHVLLFLRGGAPRRSGFRAALGPGFATRLPRVPRAPGRSAPGSNPERSSSPA